MGSPSKHSNIGVPDIAFGLLCVVSVAGILIGQLVSVIAFDTTGVDEYVPDAVIYSVAPAIVMTAVPAIVAIRRYQRRRALVITAIVFVAAITASLYTAGFFLIG